MDTLAYMLADDGKFERAVELERRAMSAQPQNQLFRLNLARIYLKAGRKEQAESELNALAPLESQGRLQPEVARLLKVARAR